MSTVVSLGSGTRLRSAVDSVEVIVVKPPSQPVELSCGGQPMTTLEAAAPPAAPAGGTDGTQLGKRYEDPETGLELLCTKGGAGTLSVDGRELGLKGTKPLPASD